MVLGGSTEVFGIIGYPMEHTMSPFMQTKAMEKMEYNGVYIPFHVKPDQLNKAIDGIVALNIRGINVTTPHKQNVIKSLDTITDAAKAIGAVNTIINDNGVLIGDNTDSYGFVQGILKESGKNELPRRICILGSGGAARGVIYGCAMKEEVEDIIIVNRTLAKAEAIAEEFGIITGKLILTRPADKQTLREVLPAVDLVVNTTTVGQHPCIDDSPVSDPSVFNNRHIVCDIITAPLQTQFLKDAADRGAHTINGLPMLAYQGARSLSLWTGREAPEDFMLSIVREQFEENQ